MQHILHSWEYAKSADLICTKPGGKREEEARKASEFGVIL